MARTNKEAAAALRSAAQQLRESTNSARHRSVIDSYEKKADALDPPGGEQPVAPAPAPAPAAQPEPAPEGTVSVPRARPWVK